MPPRTPRISTTVRTTLRLAVIRLGFRLLSVVRPQAAIRHAGALFCTPFPGTRRRALAAPLDGAVCESFDTPVGRLATYAWGDPSAQPYVLFAHGWSSHGTRFLPWVAPLREAGYAVVAFDHPAHGRSSGRRTTLPGFADALSEVAWRFGAPAGLVAHSLGGAAAGLALANGLPARRVVLIAPAADPVDAVSRFARAVRLPAHLRERLIEAFESRYGISFDAMQAHRTAPRIGSPALIVHDLEDAEVPWCEGERYARFWPQARLLTTRGLGHNRIAGDAGVIAAALRFLRGEVVGERVVSSQALPFGVC